jgi:hypothetical protein
MSENNAIPESEQCSRYPTPQRQTRPCSSATHLADQSRENDQN